MAVVVVGLKSSIGADSAAAFAESVFLTGGRAVTNLQTLSRSERLELKHVSAERERTRVSEYKVEPNEFVCARVLKG